jgi:hypothetical protein
MKMKTMLAVCAVILTAASQLPMTGSEWHTAVRTGHAITAHAAEQPEMSQEDAEMFIGFVTNNGKLTQEKIHQMEMYKVLTGTYEGEDQREAILRTTSAIRTSIALRSDQASHHVEYLSNELISYLSAAVNEENLTEQQTSQLLSIRGNTKDAMLKGICEQIDNYFLNTTEYTDTAYTIFTSYSTVSSTWNDVSSFYENVRNAYTGGALVLEAEYAGRYGYFSDCLLNYDTFDESIADDYNEANASLEKYQDTSWYSSFLDLFT